MPASLAKSATLIQFPRRKLDVSRRRFQMPDVERFKGKRDSWSLRYWTDVLVKGVVERKRKRKFLGYCPTTNEPEERKRRGEITKREAERLRTKLMLKVNSETLVVQSQISMSDFVALWFDRHVSILGAGTKAKYRNHARNHILPDLGGLRLCELDTETLQDWLNHKRKLSWATRTDLRNLVSCIFSKAIDWGYWQERNPAQRVSAGKRREARPRKLLGLEDTARLVAELPEFLQLIVAFLRTTGCRISEALGLQWKHVDLAHGWVRIEQRWYRGDLDVVKSLHGRRELPLGNVAERLEALERPGDEAYVFDRGDGQPWDDRKLMKDWIRPAARKLGIYFPGLGFHSFRREVATRMQEAGASAVETQLFLGHSKPQMTGHYTLLQRARLEKLVGKMQELGSAEGEVVAFPEEKKA